MNRIITGIIVIAIIVIGGFALLNNEQKRGDVLTLGVLTSVHDSATEKSSIAYALEIAADEINTTGGLNGKRVELLMEDSSCDAQSAGIAAQKLANLDQVFALLGGGCVAEAEAASEIVDAANILMLTPAQFTSVDEGGYVFSLAPTQTQIVDASAHYLSEEKNIKNIAFVRESGYEDTFVSALKKALSRVDITIAKDYQYDSETELTEDDIESIFSKKTDAVFVLGQDAELGVKTLDMLRAQEPDLIYFNDLGFMTKENILTYGNTLEGVIGLGFAADYDHNDRAKSFLIKYREKTMGQDPDQRAVAAYDSLHMLADAVRRVGERTEDIKLWLAEVENWPGALGPFSMEENHAIRIGVSVQTIREGKREIIATHLPR